MTEQKPTVVLVHGAFAESASWNGVIAQLQARSLEVVAVANPLRSVASDAAYVRDVIAGIGKPVVLAGHSYGGVAITEAAAGNESVVGLVYVNAFAPEHGESAFELSSRFPGSTLGDTLIAYPVSTGGDEFVIRQEMFHHQFAADVPAAQVALMAATQRPVTAAALAEGLPTAAPGWKKIPSWFVHGSCSATRTSASRPPYIASPPNVPGLGVLEKSRAPRTRSACRIPTSLRHRFSTPPRLLLGKRPW